MRSFAVLVATFVLAVPVAWVGGELHRQNCQQQHRQGCSVLPWVAGHHKHASVFGSGAGSGGLYDGSP